MRHSALTLLLSVVLISGPSFAVEEKPAVAESPASSAADSNATKKKRRASKKRKTASIAGQTGASLGIKRHPKYEMNSGFGIQIVKTAAALLTGQFRYAPDLKRPLYFGLEANYSLFSPGSVLALGAGGWYEMRVYGSPRLSVIFGAVAGAGFSQQIAFFDSVLPVLFLDGAVVQEVDDLVSVRGLFRPGIMGDYFAFNMAFQMAFRF